MTAPDANSVNSPGPVGDWEELGRRVFSGKIAHRAATNGKIKPSVFLEKTGNRKLSVDRLTSVDAAGIAAVVEDAKNAAASRPQPPNTFYGWAVVTAEAVIRARSTVEDSPLPNNRYHANIILPDSAVENEEAQKGYAATLAGRAKWKPCPDIE